ncbi:MAG: phytanoyl-CoA dioxygenase family protein [Chloroflexota bacterium]
MSNLTPEQISHFKETGYVIISDFFDATEVTAMQNELERFKTEGLGRNVATDGDGQTHSKRKINYQIIPLNDKSDLFRALPFSPKVTNAISTLIGDPFVRQLDQIFLKPGKSGAGTNWHVDNAYFRISDPTKGTGMWIALHDANVANGTLHVIPNSYKETFEHERDPDSDHHITFKADDRKAIPVEIPAGGVIFFNYGVAHCTKQNTTEHERAGLAYHFLRTDYIPEIERKRRQKGRWQMVHLTGDEATQGKEEYGIEITEGSWVTEVERLQ